jgi:curved DNA-binding protein CbpA
MCANKLQEAYETLYDEDKRRVYDARYCFRQQGFGNTPEQTQSHQRSNEELTEKLRVEKRDREWSAQAQSRASNIMRLRQDLSALEATFREMQVKQRERQAQEDSSKGLFGYLSSFWSANPGKTEEERRREELEEVQKQTSTSIRLQRAKILLRATEHDHQNMLREQDQIKNEESLRWLRAKVQKEQEAMKRRASEQKEAARARKAAFEKAQSEARRREQTEERRRREQLDSERRERDLRQELLDKLAEQNPRGTQPGPSQYRSPNPTTPWTTNNRASARNRRPKEPQTQMPCRHLKFWPKVAGRHECSICAKTFHGFVLQCPDCGILACAGCRRGVRGG